MPIDTSNTKNLNKVLNLDKKTPAKRGADKLPLLGDVYTNNYKHIEAVNSIYLGIDEIKYNIVRGEITKKINGYKSQDIKKNVLNNDIFVTFDNVIEMLVVGRLKCHYCHCNMALIYSEVRQPNQWTLDRIDNSCGHNNNNVVTACLKCNLERRTTNKDAFMFTKNLRINKIG